MMKWVNHFLLLTLLGSACQPTSESVKENPTPEVFFDLKGYFNQEIQRLEKAQPKVDKTVAINGETETKQLSSLNYNRELEIFINSDINRRDWFDKYSVDSTFHANQLERIQYTATADNLRTQTLTIHFQKGAVSKIDVQNGGNKMAAGSQQLLTYQPTRGYHIESLQHTALSKEKRFRIDVAFLN